MRFDQFPTRHVVHAALHVASLLDRRGSAVVDAHESYWRHATGGTLPPVDLERGERLLVTCGLVEERQGILHPTPELLGLLGGTTDDAVTHLTYRVLAAATDISGETPPAGSDPRLVELVPDTDRREELLLHLARRHDDTRRREIGAIGEELVVTAARDELRRLGRSELARLVRHVSLHSDQLGYDVSAPRVDGPPRMLEVKATTHFGSQEEVMIYVSRNEVEVGLRNGAQWALVICYVTNVKDRQGCISGWCGPHALAGLLPTDSHHSRWESAAVRLRLDLLDPGLPRPSV